MAGGISSQRLLSPLPVTPSLFLKQPRHGKWEIPPQKVGNSSPESRRGGAGWGAQRGRAAGAPNGMVGGAGGLLFYIFFMEKKKILSLLLSPGSCAWAPPVQEFNGITKRDKPLSAPRCWEGGHGASTPPSHLPACGGGERRCQDSAGAPPSALEPRNPPLLPRKPLASLNSGGAICSRVLSASSSVLRGDEVPGWVGGTPNLGGGFAPTAPITPGSPCTPPAG